MPALKKTIVIKKAQTLFKTKNGQKFSPRKGVYTTRMHTRNATMKNLSKPSKKSSPARSGNRSKSPVKIEKIQKSPTKLSKMQTSDINETLQSMGNKRMLHTHEDIFKDELMAAKKAHHTSMDFKANDSTYSYKNYVLSATHHLVKHPKKITDTFNGHFEIVPNRGDFKNVNDKSKILSLALNFLYFLKLSILYRYDRGFYKDARQKSDPET